MDAINPGGAAADPFVVPGVYPGHESEPGLADVTVEVDGEMFALRPDEYGGTNYTWLTGPNDGYGFGTSPTPNWSTEAHRENIRSFPAQIDPTTGYIGTTDYSRLIRLDTSWTSAALPQPEEDRQTRHRGG